MCARMLCSELTRRKSERAGGREDEHMDGRREKASERGGGREREEEAKAAVEYSTRLQQTRDKALFSAGACQRERRSYPATARGHRQPVITGAPGFLRHLQAFPLTARIQKHLCFQC